jgi:succinate dehydrogenase hydrophobic anchor subunit
MMKETKLWTWHILAGVAILILGGLHMVIMHMDGILGWFNPAPGGPLDWANVAQRSQDLLFPITYILLLGVAMFHGLYGLRNILFEAGLGKGARGFVSTVLVLGGLALFAYGTWAAIASYQL